MKHAKKIAILLAAILPMASFAACGSTDSSKEEAASSASTSEEKAEALEEETETEMDETTAPATTTTEKSTATTTVALNQSQQYEKNNTIISVLTNGFTYDTKDAPIITFNSETNSYIVVTPSKLSAADFDTTYTNGGWDSYVSNFSELSESIIQVAHYTDESANIKVIETVKTVIPFIIYDGGKVSYDMYNSTENEKACASLETFIYAYNIGIPEASYDPNTKTYKLTLLSAGSVSRDTFDSEKWDTLSNSLVSVYGTLKSNCGVLDNTMQDLVVELLDSADKTTLLRIENGNITYDYQNDSN